MGEREQRLRELGGRLRRLRADAGMTGAELAVAAGVAQPTISKIETGRMLPSVEIVERLVRALGVDESTTADLLELLDRLQAEVVRRRRQGAAVARQVEASEQERAAAVVRSFQCAVMPALLQTPDYARAALLASRFLGRMDDDELTRAVTAVVERQGVLYEQGRQFQFVLTESALRTWPGSASLMIAQLDRLSVLASLPHVRIGVLPWRVPLSTLPLHGFTLYDETAATAETFTTDLTITDAKEIQTYLEAFVAFQDNAVYDDELRTVLGGVMEDYRHHLTEE